MLENNDVIGFIGLNHVLMAIMLADATFYINTAQTAEKKDGMMQIRAYCSKDKGIDSNSLLMKSQTALQTKKAGV